VKTFSGSRPEYPASVVAVDANRLVMTSSDKLIIFQIDTL
jgi:hypothetical protein